MPDIKEWVKRQLKAGYSKEAIKQELINGGYNPNLFDEALRENLIKATREKSIETIRKKSHHKILLAAALVVFSMVVAFVFYPELLNQFNLSFSQLSSQPFKPEDAAFISESDLNFQSKVKNITGYDWITFLNADGSENAKLTALLFLANEIDVLEDDFGFVDRSVGISKDELGISRLDATDNSRENMLKLIGNVKSGNNVFFSKGLETAKIRANRLSVIENFFKRYALPEGVLNTDATEIFAEMLGLTVDDYSKLISLMIVNYNLFLVE